MAKKKIEVRHRYDKESDVLYIRFGEQEPTHIENLDDFLLLEIGWFSGLPRGIRIIGPKYHKISSVQLTMVVQRIKKQVRELVESQRKLLKEQVPLYTDFCNSIPDLLAAVH